MLVNEIFCSIDGEVNHYGLGTMSTFVRFAGCNLTCDYCDVRDMSDGKEMTVDEIVATVQEFPARKVTITGGEPLIQDHDELEKLLTCFHFIGKKVTIETNGTIEIPGTMLVLACWVIDFKIGQNFALDSIEISNLFPGDYIKFVIANKEDYEFARNKYYELRKRTVANFAFSPVCGELYPAKLFSWMLEDGLCDVKLNVQLNKYINLR